jgi:hypothetical protein
VLGGRVLQPADARLQTTQSVAFPTSMVDLLGINGGGRRQRRRPRQRQCGWRRLK